MTGSVRSGRPRRRTAAAVPALLFALLLLLGAGPPSAGAQAAAAAERADGDGDGLFDDLERRLARASGGERVSVLVVLELPATQARVSALSKRVGGFAVSRRFGLVPAFAAEMSKAQATRLASFLEVAHVEENVAVRAAVNSAQQSFGVIQGRADAGVDGDGDGSSGTYSPGDLVAAVIDSGIDTGHQDLDEGKVIGWTDLVNGLPMPYDDYGHGTAVASVLAGEGDARADRLYAGVAPGAALVGVKVLNGSGVGTEEGVVAAVEWVVAHKSEFGIEAINLSVEAPGCADGTDALSLAVNAAYDAGLVVVAAAGNSGPGRCTIGSPGAAAGAFTVGAMSDLGAGGFKQAAFSSRGPTLDGRIKPDVAAPGVGITSAAAGTSAGYAAQSGTSLATPFVTGLALLMLDANPALAAQAVEDGLAGAAVDWARGGDNTLAGSSGPDIDYGAGRLDGYAALEAAAGQDFGAGPATPAHVLEEGQLAGANDFVDFPLEIADASVPIAATLILPSVSSGAASSPDFDLYLLDPNGLQVASATSSARQDELGYVPPAPGGYVLRVRSSAGSGEFFVDISAGLPPPPPAVAPENVAPPAVLGAARQGSTLGSTDGLWTGTPQPSLARRWQRCDQSGASCLDIAGATGTTYLLQAGDVGARIRVVVSASNVAGAAEAASAATELVAPAPPRVARASAVAHGHRVVVRARTLGCSPCLVQLRIRIRGSWVTVRMKRALDDLRPGKRWIVVLRGVPSGSRPWRVLATDLDTGLVARSALGKVVVPGA